MPHEVIPRRVEAVAQEDDEEVAGGDGCGVLLCRATMPGSWTWESFPSLPGGLFGRQERA